MAKDEPKTPKPDASESPARPLDELLAKRSKLFRDWKEEREYLRRKWGPQGARIDPRKAKDDDAPAEEE